MDSPVSCWINVEVAGVTVGDGPIRHVVSWTSTALLSKAGSFSLTVAARDPRADLLRSKRVVRCWAIVNSTATEIGAGIIDEIRWTADGLHLVASGSDLLAELRYRSVRDLQLYGETLATPTKVWLSLEDPPVFTDLTDTYNGDFVGATAFTLTSSDGFIYIGYSDRFTVLYTFQGAAFNDNNSTLQYRYSAFDHTWNDAESIVPLLSDDTNIVADTPFPAAHASNNPQVDGTNALLLRAPNDWVNKEVNSFGAFWLRIDPASLLDEVSVVEFAIGLRTISATDVSEIMNGYAPGEWNMLGDTWSSDALLVPTVPPVAGEVYRDTAAGSYAVFSGELVLSALVKIASRSGESFRLGAGRKLHWLRTNGTAASFADSGVRAVRQISVARQATNPLTCQIVSLEELRDTNNLITRIYPYGAGNGRARASLVNVTDILGGVTAATLGAAGTGYTAGDVLTIVQVGASGGTLTVDTVDGGGAITGVTLTTAGMGYSVANGLATTVAPPGGSTATINVTGVNPYLIDKTVNYIVNRTAETTYGQIERVMSFKDIRATDDLTYDSPAVCDQLAQAALAFLQRHDSEQQFYRLTVVGLPGLLQVGTRIRVIWREAIEDRVIKYINDDFIVLSATVQFSDGNVATTQLDVGTTDALPATDAEVLADVIEAGATYESHSQYVNALVVI